MPATEDLCIYIFFLSLNSCSKRAILSQMLRRNYFFPAFGLLIACEIIKLI